MFRLWLLSLCTLGFALVARTEEIALRRYDRVEIAPTKTSIYIGSVAMTMPAFARKGGVYESTYTAKVFPYFFYNEEGTLSIDVPDEALRRLARGEPIEFTGRAVNSSGAKRHVEGRAVPADATSGKIKVRVFISKRTQLIFNTTYRFAN
jgi:hypothetical protein